MSEVNSISDDEWKRAALKAEKARRVKTILTLFVLTGAVALLLSSCQPTVDAHLETALPAESGPVELFGAKATRPIIAQLRSFGLLRDTEGAIAANGEHILIRLPTSERGCARLRAQIGGGCDGPQPPRWPQEDLKIQAALPFSISAVLKQAPHLSLQPITEPTERRAPLGWSLVSDAATTTVQFECGSPRGSRLLNCRGRPAPPAEAGFEASRAVLDAAKGTLSVDDDEEPIPSSGQAIEIEPNGSHTVRFGARAPAAAPAQPGT
jgi:hypothetical protein